MALHFCGASAHISTNIGLFEFPKTSVSGHKGQTGASLDVGPTLAGSSDENIGLMSGPRVLVGFDVLCVCVIKQYDVYVYASHD